MGAFKYLSFSSIVFFRGIWGFGGKGAAAVGAVVAIPKVVMGRYIAGIQAAAQTDFSQIKASLQGRLWKGRLFFQLHPALLLNLCLLCAFFSPFPAVFRAAGLFQPVLAPLGLFQR